MLWMTACALQAIAETFLIPITMLLELLMVRMPDMEVFVVSILPAATRKGTMVGGGTDAANSS